MRDIKKKSISWIKKPQNFFIFISIITGIFIAIILPPFNGPDEAAHIFRVYEFTKGDLLLNRGTSTKTNTQGNGYLIPDHITRVNQSSFNSNEKDIFKRIETLQKSGTIQDTDTKTFEVFEGAGVYSPIVYSSYLPSSFIANLLNTNGYFYTIMLRLSGLLAASFIIYFAIRIIPIGKWFVVAIGLLPMTLHQITVVSTDGLIISSSIAFIAIVLYVRQNFKQLSRKQHLLYASLALISGLSISSKPGYWPILLMVVLAVPNLKALMKKPGIFYTSAVLLTILSYIAWFGLITVNHQADMKSYFEKANPGSTLIGKREFISQAINPITFINTFYSTYIEQPGSYLDTPKFEGLNKYDKHNYQPSFMFESFIGKFGSLNIFPPSWISMTVVGTLILSFLISYQRRKGYFLKKDKLIASIAIISSFSLVSLIFWMSWTAKDMPFIFGVQGRYFIPLIILFVFLVPSKRIINLPDSTNLRLLSALFVINCYITVITIFDYFYA